MSDEAFQYRIREIRRICDRIEPMKGTHIHTGMVAVAEFILNCIDDSYSAQFYKGAIPAAIRELELLRQQAEYPDHELVDTNYRWSYRYNVVHNIKRAGIAIYRTSYGKYLIPVWVVQAIDAYTNGDFNGIELHKYLCKMKPKDDVVIHEPKRNPSEYKKKYGYRLRRWDYYQEEAELFDTRKYMQHKKSKYYKKLNKCKYRRGAPS